MLLSSAKCSTLPTSRAARYSPSLPLATIPLPGPPRSPHSVLGITACNIRADVRRRGARRRPPASLLQLQLPLPLPLTWTLPLPLLCVCPLRSLSLSLTRTYTHTHLLSYSISFSLSFSLLAHTSRCAPLITSSALYLRGDHQREKIAAAKKIYTSNSDTREDITRQ